MVASVIIGLMPILLDRILTYGDNIDPIYPAAEIVPIAKDLTVVGNSSES